MKIKVYLLVLIMLAAFLGVGAEASELVLDSESACLMEVSTGKVLYEKNADEKMEPASVTKIMSLLLVFEGMEQEKFTLDTLVSASGHASSMGGSQIWLEEGESMSVHEMLKAVVVASANDCTVALGELVAGSEEGFVALMNERARELGMNNTSFVNCTGLPAENHYTTARDIAIMTRELCKHKKIYEYTKIWTDTLRGGNFGITNTNKLIRFYNGATGMKTGYTSSALYCMSATAQRGEMELIASVMKSRSSDKRFADAKKLLEYGFANYTLYTPQQINNEKIKVVSGFEDDVEIKCEMRKLLVEKGKQNKTEMKTELADSITAPFEKNTKVGYVSFFIDGEKIAQFPIVTTKGVKKITYFEMLRRLFLSSVCVR